MKQERARSCGGYQEGKIRGNEGQRGERKKKEEKDLFAQAYI